MKYKKFVIFELGLLLVVVAAHPANARPPPPQRDGPFLIAACVDPRCDRLSGPVCGIDASGVPRTFEDKCSADLAYCREGRYYAIVKYGEC